MFRNLSAIPQKLGSRLGMNVAGFFSLQAFNTFLSFLTALLLGRFIGPDGYGAYSFALSWLVVFVTFSKLGFDRLLVREISRNEAERNYETVSGLLKFSRRITIGASIAIILIAAPVIYAIQPLVEDPFLWYALLFSLPMVLFLSLLRIYQGITEAYYQPLKGAFPAFLVMPLLLIIGIIVLYFLFPEQLNVYYVLAVKLSSCIVALILIHLNYRKILSPEVKQSQPVYYKNKWIRAALSMVSVSAVYVIYGKTDIIMLGILADADSVGIYSVALKATLLITMAMKAVDKTLSPNFATLYSQGKTAKLQHLVKRSVGYVTIVAFLVCLLIIVLSPIYFGMFGPAFYAGSTALIILCGTKFLDAASGSTGALLLMTGFEKLAALNMGAVALLNIVFNMLLIPWLGIEGAALATALATITAKTSQGIWLYIHTGINPSVIPFRYSAS